jgi:transcriptional regulator with XRE-family HTH domain
MTIDAKEYLEKTCGKLTFGRMISSLRKCEELSQTEFAKMLGISKQYLCDIEKGRKGVSPEKAREMAKKLGYSEQYFIQLSLQDQLTQAGIKLEVHLEKPQSKKAA